MTLFISDQLYHCSGFVNLFDLIYTSENMVSCQGSYAINVLVIDKSTNNFTGQIGFNCKAVQQQIKMHAVQRYAFNVLVSTELRHSKSYDS